MSKFLIVRLGALGDIVHAIPVAAALRRAFPDARIDWLVSAKHREFLDLVPVDRSPPGRQRSRRRAAAARRCSRRCASSAATRYDVAIDLQGLIKSALIARMSGRRAVIGFAHAYLREPLARLFYTDVHDPGGGGIYATGARRGTSSRSIWAAAAARASTTGARRISDRRTSTSAVARSLPQADRRPLRAAQSRAAWPNKRWPPDRLAAVAAALPSGTG